MSYSVRDDGSLDQGKLFFDGSALAVTAPGLPDGLKVDRDGYLFATGPGGVLVFRLRPIPGRMLTTAATANCAFGDDGHSLYISATCTYCEFDC